MTVTTVNPTITGSVPPNGDTSTPKSKPSIFQKIFEDINNIVSSPDGLFKSTKVFYLVTHLAPTASNVSKFATKLFTGAIFLDVFQFVTLIRYPFKERGGIKADWHPAEIHYHESKPHESVMNAGKLNAFKKLSFLAAGTGGLVLWTNTFFNFLSTTAASVGGLVVGGVAGLGFVAQVVHSGLKIARTDAQVESLHKQIAAQEYANDLRKRRAVEQNVEPQRIRLSPDDFELAEAQANADWNRNSERYLNEYANVRKKAWVDVVVGLLEIAAITAALCVAPFAVVATLAVAAAATGVVSVVLGKRWDNQMQEWNEAHGFRAY